ncbi:MAG: DUF5011 domain-containing protein, partial [Bacilli bacterium]|nr:DUF5011 domain-containing protein [Bacilli bacterium]
AIAKTIDDEPLFDIQYEIKYQGQIIDEVDVSKLGTYEITYMVEHLGYIASVKRTVVVEDKIPPDLIIPSNITLKVEEVQDYNFMEGVSVSDNSLETITVTLTSDIIIYPGEYTVVYSASDSSGNTTTKTRYVTVIDVGYPVITILGNNPVNVNVENAYTDAGATAIDDVDGDITEKIKITGTVDVNVVGTYTVKYTVNDKAGNETIATRTVNVIDNVPPIITFGTNGNSTYAKSRNTMVNVSDTHSSINTSSLKYLWNTSTATPSEGSINGAFTNGVTLSTPLDVTGEYYLWILAKDIVGNTIIQRSNGFRLDNINPVITLNGNSTVNVNVGTSYTDAGATATDVHSGINGNVISSGTVNINVPGTYIITYTVTDNAGNTALTTRTVKVIDNVPPTITFGTNGNSTYAKSRSTTVNVSDAHSTVSSRHYQWTTSTTAPSSASFTTTFTNGGTLNTPAGVTGGRYLWIKGVDSSGNERIGRSNVFNLDNSAPVISGVSLSAGSITTNSYIITRSGNATDAHSGLATNPYIYQTSPDGSTWTTICTNNTTTCEITGLSSGTTYYYRLCINDNLGHQSCLGSQTVTTSTPPQYLYYSAYLGGSNPYRLYRTNLEGSGRTTITQGDYEILTVAANSEYLYYGAYLGGSNPYRLYRTNLSGSSKTTITQGDYEILTVAANSEYLYYGAYLGGSNPYRLYRTNLSGSSKTTITQGDYKILTVAANSEYLYYGAYLGGSNPYRLYRTNLSGSSKTTITQGSNEIIEVATNNQYLYYAVKSSSSSYKIYRTNLEGNSRITVVDSGSEIIAIATNNQYLYYAVKSSSSSYKVYRVNLEGSGRSTVIDSSWKITNMGITP